MIGRLLVWLSSVAWVGFTCRGWGKLDGGMGGTPACAPFGNRVAEEDQGHSLTIALAATTANQNVNTFHGPFNLSVSGCPIGFTSMSSFFKASTTP